MKIYLFLIFSIASQLTAMDLSVDFYNDVKKFNDATENIKTIDAKIVSQLVKKIRQKWGYEQQKTSYQASPKNCLKDINLEK